MPNADYDLFRQTLKTNFPWMPRELRDYYGRRYGTRTAMIAGEANGLSDLGRHFGGTLYEAEVRYLVAHEWALSAEDVIWRRTKHRLTMTEAEQEAFATWFNETQAKAA